MSNTALVLSVSSPNVSQIYTQGDRLLLYVNFDLPIAFVDVKHVDQETRANHSCIYLMLKPGGLYRKAYVDTVVNDGYTLSFVYQVGLLDTAVKLDYICSAALVLEHGANIYRQNRDLLANGELLNTASPVDPTLPAPGSPASLSRMSELEINTHTPNILDFFVEMEQERLLWGSLLALVGSFGDSVDTAPFSYLAEVVDQAPFVLRIAPATSVINGTNSTNVNNSSSWAPVNIQSAYELKKYLALVRQDFAYTLTTGDHLDLDVWYDAKVDVRGSPVVYVKNDPVDLLAQVMTAPMHNSSNASSVLTAILLVPGHELTSTDIGSDIVLSGALYAIQDLQDDMVWLDRPYSQTPVHLGLPVVKIRTPDFRPAYYHSGSGTSVITYRYYIRRGDISSQVTVCTYSALVSCPMALNNGKVLR